MIFDFHTHISPDDDVGKLLDAMDQNGVDMCGAAVVVAPGGDCGQGANKLLHQPVARQTGWLRWCASLRP